MNNTKWISMSSFPVPFIYEYSNMNASFYVRKEFEINGKIKDARISICALGLGVCTINGQDVTDEVLTTPYTQYDKRVIYRDYDVTEILHSGINAIGVHVGNGFYNDNMNIWNDMMATWKDNPKVAVKLVITYQSGETQTIQTDTTWKCIGGSSVYNHMRQGEKCDANLRPVGFDLPEFDDDTWENAVIAHEPGGILQTTDMPPIRVIRTITPVAVDGDTYDFGINTSGWAKIIVTGEKGQEIKLKYLEGLDADSDKHINRYNIREDNPLKHEDVFICSGRQKEMFRPSFCYHGFRYVKVLNTPEDFEIVAEVVHTDLKQIGHFECNDEMLNKIHKACVNSIITNYHGLPTDCPHREQNGWTGDALMSNDQAMLNFDMYDAYNKWFDDFKDAQRPNGQLPGIIPTAGFGYNWGSGPSWDSALIIIPWNIYVYTGKSDVMKKMWENMVRYMQYFERMTTDYIAGFGLEDWCTPVRNFFCPVEVTDTAYLYYDCKTMAKIASVIGEDAQYWEEKAACVKKAWREKFLDREDLKKYQTFYACAIYQGLLEKEEIPDMAKQLAELIAKEGYKTTSGMQGIKYVFSALSENGYIDVLYKMVTNPEYPSYAYWINNGNTALCECWSMNSSRNHHMYSEVDNWLYRYVGGIRYTDSELVISPVLFDEISDFVAEHGGVKVVRNKEKVTVTIPCSARIDIGDCNKIFEKGTYEFEI